MTVEPKSIDDEPGVYSSDSQGQLQRVHLYQDGEFGLQDVVEWFGLGRVAPENRPNWVSVVLTEKELRELKVLADAYSFDYAEEFIEMCLEMHRFSTLHPAQETKFEANF